MILDVAGLEETELVASSIGMGRRAGEQASASGGLSSTLRIALAFAGHYLTLV